jgi:caffeoyl-CoA O-methyltransferase
MEFIPAAIDAYIQQHTTAHNNLLEEIATATANHAQPHMMSGHVQGRILSMLSKMQQPKYILEIGTFTGFSALCLAEGLTKNGELHTIELREIDAVFAKSFFDKSVYKKNIQIHIGNALEIIKTLPYTWDLVFIDADKVSYIEYYKMVLPQLNANGIIIADNVLYHGEVAHETIKGKNAKAIDAFNKYIAADTTVEQVILSVRDGLSIVRKKENNEL